MREADATQPPDAAPSSFFFREGAAGVPEDMTPHSLLDFFYFLVNVISLLFHFPSRRKVGGHVGCGWLSSAGVHWRWRNILNLLSFFFFIPLNPFSVIFISFSMRNK